MRGVLPVTVLVLFVLLFVGVVPSVATASNQARIGVRIHVPVVQRLTVVEPVTITLPHPGQSLDEPLLYERVGRIDVTSNANWALTVQSGSTTGAGVFVKPSGDRLAQWTELNGRFAVYAGEPGAHSLSWDIRIDPLNIYVPSEEAEQVELLFTLTQL